VLAKAWYPWCDGAEVDRMIALHGLPSRAPHSITGERSFKEELVRTRARGYSTSIGEYYAEHNAVGCAVLAPDGTPQLLLVITGFASQITVQAMPDLGRRLRVAVEAISADVFSSPRTP
jgi:DNA-binding IclR family transcriptional regulator